MRRSGIIVAFTGASGAVYGTRLVSELLARGKKVTVLASNAGRKVLAHEMNLSLPDDPEGAADLLRSFFSAGPGCLDYYGQDDLCAPVASGSAAAEAMVVCPCTMGTASRIASGISGNLLERCADVMLKERRPLLLVPRETPLSRIHLDNLLRLADAGALVVPAMPAFYHHPQRVDDLVAFVVGKILDLLHIENDLFRRWREESDQ